MPQPPARADVPYAQTQPELNGLSIGALVSIMVESKSWQTVMVPKLAALDEARSKRGPKPAYTSEELERAVLYSVIAGKASYCHARDALAGDRESESRQLLGFDKSRPRYGSSRLVRKSLDGVPSKTTIWRHQARWGEKAHRDAYRELFEALIEEHLTEFPEFAEELRLINIDGTMVISHRCSFDRVDKKTGEVIRRATLHGGGFRPREGAPDGKSGHGHMLVSVSTARGLPVAAQVGPLNAGEGEAAVALMDGDFSRVIKPHLIKNNIGLGVVSMDSAYGGRETREAMRRHGFVENCHTVSHADSERSVTNAKRKRKDRFEIQGKPNWFADGHMQLICACGEGQVSKRISGGPATGVTVRSEGKCPTCGPITITAGQWRTAQNPKSFVRVIPGDEHHIDWRFGNPLTFDDPVAERYGNARFGHNEGFHGHLATRFGLIRGKRWYRNTDQVERHTFQIFAVMHALAMEQRRRNAEPSTVPNITPVKPVSGAPPGKPLALAA